MKKEEQEVDILDIIKSLSHEELEMIKRGKKHWKLKPLDKLLSNKLHKKEVDVVNTTIDLVIENTWAVAKFFYENKYLEQGKISVDDTDQQVLDLLFPSKDCNCCYMTIGEHSTTCPQYTKK